MFSAKPFLFYQTKIVQQLLHNLHMKVSLKDFFGYLPQFNNGKLILPISQHYYRVWCRAVLDNYSSSRIKLKLIGNGYYLKDEKNRIHMYSGQSHLFSFLLPEDMTYLVRGRKKRTLHLIGTNYTRLVNCATIIQRCAIPDIYRHKGLRFSKQIFRRKEGKKKFV